MMVDQAAKEAGYTILAYHGSRADDRSFTVFRMDSSSSLGKGAFFTPDKEAGDFYDAEEKSRGFYLKADLPGFEESQRGLTIEQILAGETTPTSGASDNASWDMSYAHTEIIVTSPEQIKSADPVTYDDNGNVIPLSARFDPDSPDIRGRLPEPALEVDFD